MQSLSESIRAALLTADPRAKAMATRKLLRAWRKGELAWDFSTPMPDRPARPDRPELLPPNRMPRRGRGGSDRARIALWHSLAHIERALPISSALGFTNCHTKAIGMPY